MCVASVGKIIKINGNVAEVDINGNIFEANIKLISPKVGDDVLIHAGYVLEILKKDRAQELKQIYAEIEEIFNDNP